MIESQALEMGKSKQRLRCRSTARLRGETPSPQWCASSRSTARINGPVVSCFSSSSSLWRVLNPNPKSKQHNQPISSSQRRIVWCSSQQQLKMCRRAYKWSNRMDRLRKGPGSRVSSISNHCSGPSPIRLCLEMTNTFLISSAMAWLFLQLRHRLELVSTHFNLMTKQLSNTNKRIRKYL